MSVDSVLAVGPRMLGRYELLAPVARGGMGQVWVGRLRGARGFNKLVAIKTLLSMPDAEGRLERMLFEEARIASLIHHANVVHTHELGEHDGELYLVMEWVDGESLSFIMQRAETRGAIPLPVAVHWIAQTLLGLHAAHELTDESGAPLGVVHRDASPHNVLITYGGMAKLVDFGIAKAMNESATCSGEVKGKLSYIAPEQLLCEGVDRRADIFAIGIVLYLLTTRQHPFHGASSLSALQGISSDEPARPPSQLVADYPPMLEEVVLKALQKSAASRFSTAEEMFRALQRAVPQAFEPGVEQRSKEYLAELVGDRILMRREVLRLAQLDADARACNDHVRNQSPGRSWTSLSAISLEENAPGNATLPREPSLPVSRIAPRRRRIGLLTAAGSLIAVIGVVWALRATDESRPLDTTRVAPERPNDRTAARDSDTGLVSVASASPERAPTPREIVRAPAETDPPTSGVASMKASPPSPAIRPAGRKARLSSRSADLIEPDYAR